MSAAWLWLPALATLAGVALARRYALHRQLIDHPGEARRNHRLPTPRGGGIAMLLVLLGVVLAMAWRCSAVRPAAPGLILALVLVGGIGWWDDHHPLSARLRLLVQAVAAASLCWAGARLGWPWWLWLGLFPLSLVLVNFWNFMDGINGIAASQALLVALAAAGLLAGPWQPFALALAAICAGFLPWNFPRARIFMGDVGSGSLGLALAWLWAALAAHDLRAGGWLLLPLAPFLLDAGLTLLARMWRGERWWQAHSRHFYQRWARHRGAHVGVTFGYALFTFTGVLLAHALYKTEVDRISAGTQGVVVLLWYVLLITIGAVAGRRFVPKGADCG
ncbi:lipopolysaccharide biosynthesis protein [Luteimonas sp. e5]